jgi:hypothetical protein
MLPKFFSRYGHVYTASDMSRAYKTIFRTQLGLDYVLPDLAEFCHANDPAPRDSDLWLQGRAAGRRDVWLRVQEHLGLSEEQLQDLYVGRSKLKPGEF